MLFKVKNTQVYLLASMHLLPKEWKVLPPSTIEAYRQSEFCVFEDNPIKSIYPYPPMKNDRNIFYPWIQSIIKTNELAKELGLFPEYGIDLQLFNKAIADQKKISYLDEENACNAFAQAPIKEQELMLDITLNHPEKIKSLLNEIYSAWREWNIASLAELLNIQVSMCPELHKRLVTTRNLAWSPKIISTITNGASAIITFGALHFLGVDGICHQIEDHGHHEYPP